jgi:hypothetical protein
MTSEISNLHVWKCWASPLSTIKSWNMGCWKGFWASNSMTNK